MPAVVGVDLRVQRFQILEALPVEFQRRAPTILGQQRFYAGQAGTHDVTHAGLNRIGQVLRQLADDESVLACDLTAVGLLLAGNQLQRRRLAGAVTADQADALAGLDAERGFVKNTQLAEVEGYFVESKQ